MTNVPSQKIVFFANSDWYLYNFRLSLISAARSNGLCPVLISPPGPYAAKLQELGFDWRALPMERRSLDPIAEFHLLVHLVSLLRDLRPVIVHSFTVKSVAYGSLAARLARVPARVGAIAGLGYVFSSEDRTAKLLRPVVRTLLRFALGGRGSRLILQNPDDAAVIARLRLASPSRIRVIRSSGVDCSRYVPRAATSLSEQPMRVLLASRLLADKGVREFVEAARLLRARGCAVQFLLAGAPDVGNPSALSETEIRSWLVDGAVEWLGHVDDMVALLASVDVVALPSYYGEGVPRILIEAAAMGLPLITTDTPGCREVVRDGVEGIHVPPRDAVALAAAVERFRKDPILRGRLGANARETAVREFDDRIVITRTLDLYREMLPGHL